MTMFRCGGGNGNITVLADYCARTANGAQTDYPPYSFTVPDKYVGRKVMLIIFGENNVVSDSSNPNNRFTSASGIDLLSEDIISMKKYDAYATTSPSLVCEFIATYKVINKNIYIQTAGINNTTKLVCIGLDDAIQYPEGT